MPDESKQTDEMTMTTTRLTAGAAALNIAETVLAFRQADGDVVVHVGGPTLAGAGTYEPVFSGRGANREEALIDLVRTMAEAMHLGDRLGRGMDVSFPVEEVR